MDNLKYTIDSKSNIPKFKQLIDLILESIKNKKLQPGDMLPSVNAIMKESHIARDTVVKVYAELKKTGLVVSVPNRGYFVTDKTTKVFLLLDTFKAHKEVLYNSIVKNLPDNFTVDLHFHHYSINAFKKIIDDNLGKYNKYLIMNFDHPKVSEIIKKVPQDKLLLIDWKIQFDKNQSIIYQDFGEAVYDCFKDHLETVLKYKEFVFCYPNYTHHPKITIEFFKLFCVDYEIKYSVIFDPDNLEIRHSTIYFLISDRTLALFLDKCKEKGFEVGRDIGVISYNETPLKKYINNGITVITTNFELMGKKAAEFVRNGIPIQFKAPTKLILRSSFK